MKSVKSIGSNIQDGLDVVGGGVSSGVSGGISDLISGAIGGIFGKSPAGRGQDARTELSNMYPELTPWELAGVSSAGSSISSAQRQQETARQGHAKDQSIQDRMMKNQEKVAKINTKPQNDANKLKARELDLMELRVGNETTRTASDTAFTDQKTEKEHDVNSIAGGILKDFDRFISGDYKLGEMTKVVLTLVGTLSGARRVQALYNAYRVGKLSRSEYMKRMNEIKNQEKTRKIKSSKDKAQTELTREKTKTQENINSKYNKKESSEFGYKNKHSPSDKIIKRIYRK